MFYLDYQSDVPERARMSKEQYPDWELCVPLSAHRTSVSTPLVSLMKPARQEEKASTPKASLWDSEEGPLH